MKQYYLQKITCKICQKIIGSNNFNRHLQKYHNTNSINYYNTHIDTSTKTCKAPECKNMRKFLSITSGYTDYCSLKCCYKEKTPRNQKIGKQKKGKTYTEMYGEKKSNLIKSVLVQKLKLWRNTPEGRKIWIERNKKIALFKTGMPRSKETIRKIKKAMKNRNIGEKNPNYKGGTTPLSYLITESIENKTWKNKIFENSNACVVCGTNREVQVHHLDSLSFIIQKYNITKNNWRKHKKILFNIKNGVVLCYEHHNANNNISFHSMYGRIKVVKKDFQKYMEGLGIVFKPSYIEWGLDTKK